MQRVINKKMSTLPTSKINHCGLSLTVFSKIVNIKSPLFNEFAGHVPMSLFLLIHDKILEIYSKQVKSLIFQNMEL